ncbi:F0F1 ATP synthase subunit epsilon [Fervidicella metallireducens AeB]|uniref:ATP synthase epsilon chain n=1 Tax=Fervidicella metallireducens AeB TaxID=1403537 RepID=A0A017S0X1_9CLOT|nr:ATP synthase F1 subunit epsilon [Fervidicella metallireducens]EYE89830.1 F0F1 ATP synthase subunit epsilon [Fervidicella metallireducens AeB]
MAAFNFKLITPEKVFFEGEVNSVSMNSITGRVQILANHVGYATGVLPCIIKIVVNNETKKAVVSGGFFQISDNKGVLFADSAEWPEEVDIERAKRAMERAKNRLESKDKNLDVERAKLALLRAMTRLKITEIK